MVEFLSRPDIQQEYLPCAVDYHNHTTFPGLSMITDDAEPCPPPNPSPSLQPPPPSPNYCGMFFFIGAALVLVVAIIVSAINMK
jgi:hypothetical protein